MVCGTCPGFLMIRHRGIQDIQIIKEFGLASTMFNLIRFGMAGEVGILLERLT
jgi:hypothetical protein